MAKKWDDDRVEHVRNATKVSYNFVSQDWNGNGSAFDRAQKSAMAYERIIDLSTWQPNSEIYFPFARIAVDVMLPNVLWWIFHNGDLFELVPQDDTPFATAATVRDYIQFRLRNSMNIFMSAYPTLKDAIKLGTGYGTVEMHYVTPWLWQTRDEPETKSVIRELTDQKQPTPVPVYRYIRFGRILPSPGGGPQPEDRDWVIWIDHMSEYQLRMMMQDENSGVSGDIEAIVKNVDAGRTDGNYTSVQSLMAHLTNENSSYAVQDLQNQDRTGSKLKLPALIPVVKYFGRNRHIWLANGETVIYEREDTVQTLRNPILKATITPDADLWYTDGIISASDDVFDATNIFYNTIIDMIDMISRPRWLLDRQVVPAGLNMEPWGVTDAYGPTENALRALELPGLRAETVRIMEELRGVLQLATGQSEQMQAGVGASGLVRGGSAAFETLLATTGARDQLAATVLDMCFVKPLIELTLLMEQLHIELTGERRFRVPVADGRQGKMVYEQQKVDYADLRRNLEVDIVLNQKLRNSMADANMRFGVVNGILSSPVLARQAAPEQLFDYLVGDRFISRMLRNGANPQKFDESNMLWYLTGRAGGGGRAAVGNIPGAGGAGGGAAQQSRLGGLTQ